jgi:hypothetical protein
MTENEAARVLNVRPNAKPREILEACNSRRREYVCRAQFATDPHERDVANNGLRILQDAYYSLTGTQVPNQIKPHATGATQSQLIPRASLGARPVQQYPPTFDRSPTTTSNAESQSTGRRRWWAPSQVWVNGRRSWVPTPEKVVASLICGAIFLTALLIFACR